MKIRLSKGAKGSSLPKGAALPFWSKQKGTIIWLTATAGICIAILVISQSIPGGATTGIGLAILGAITSVLLKLATPYLKARAGDKKIAKIKAMQGASRVPSAKAEAGRVNAPVSYPVDTSQLKATDSFAVMHMGPPEIIDLDLSRRHDKRGKVAIDGPAIDDQKNQAVAKAIELEDSGAVDKAIAEYTRAVALARQLGRDDEVASFENRIRQLKQEKRDGWGNVS